MNIKRLSLVIFLISNYAHASATDDFFDLSLNELMNLKVESATKIEQLLSEIPAHVTILTRKEIENSGYTSLIQALQHISGIYIEEDTEEVFIGMRGTINGGIQFLINGVPRHPSLQKGLSTVEINRLNIPIKAIDRIEVVRGPMSVTYGNNAFQGMVNIITNESDISSAMVSYSDKSSHDIFLRHSAKVSTGQLTINAGQHSEYGFEGHYKDMMSASAYAALPIESQKTMKGNFGRTFDYSEFNYNDNRLTASLLYQKSQYNIYPTYVPINDNKLSNETWQSSLQYRYDLGNSLKSQTSIILSEEKYNIDSLSFATPLLRDYQKQVSSKIELEQTLTKVTPEDTSLLFGYRYRKSFDLTNDAEIYNGTEYIFDNDIKISDTEYHDIFAQSQSKIHDDLEVMIGVRYTYLPNRYYANTIKDKFNSASTDVLYTEDRNLFNYRAALLYHRDNHEFKLLHGTASQDVESSSISEPKKIQTTEFVHSFNADNWSLSHSIFYNLTESVLRRSLSFDGSNFITATNNDGKWETLGYEANLALSYSQDWRFEGSLTLQNTDDLTSVLDIGYSPETLINLKAFYNSGNNTYALLGNYVGSRKSDWEYVDTNNDQVIETIRLGQSADAYWLLNASWLHRASEEFKLQLKINNLLDEEYRYPANELSDLEQGLIGYGRQIYFSVEYSF